jgi:hypothetical protein
MIRRRCYLLAAKPNAQPVFFSPCMPSKRTWIPSFLEAANHRRFRKSEFIAARKFNMANKPEVNPPPTFFVVGTFCCSSGLFRDRAARIYRFHAKPGVEFGGSRDRPIPPPR